MYTTYNLRLFSSYYNNNKIIIKQLVYRFVTTFQNIWMEICVFLRFTDGISTTQKVQNIPDMSDTTVQNIILEKLLFSFFYYNISRYTRFNVCGCRVVNEKSNQIVFKAFR